MNIPIHRRLSVLVFALCLASGAMAAPQAEEGAPTDEASKAQYWQGHDALARGDWQRAREIFHGLERSERERTGGKPDAALYWQAYALEQAGRASQALRLAEDLQRKYRDSPWVDDAQALAARLAASRDGAAAADARDEDALMALDALLASGNAKAVPMLQRVLQGDYSDRVKGRAIFVLSQLDAGAADAALQSIVSGDASPKLKAEALRMIAAGGRRESLDRLLPLYGASSDEKVRRAVLEAFLIGNRSDLLLQVLEAETDPARRRDVITRLGALRQADALKSLYGRSPDPADRRAVLRGLGVAGAGDVLLALARSEQDPELRAEAVRSVGIAGGSHAGGLVALYEPAAPQELKRAVIDALMIAGSAPELVTLYRKETDQKLRRELLRRIATTGDDAALELVDEQLRR